MTPEQKAALIRVGMKADPDAIGDVIDSLCLAVAMLTSPDKTKREAAKRQIREYVEIGKNKTGA